MDPLVAQLLAGLVTNDERLRSTYAALAADPDLATERDEELRHLHEERSALARSAGLALLAAHRASLTAPELPTCAPEPALSSGSLPADPPSSPTPVDAGELERWRTANSRPGSADYRDRYAVPWEETLGKLMERLGPARDLDFDIEGEIEALDRVGKEPLLAQWAQLPRHIQLRWLSLLVTRTRAVKDHSLSADIRAAVKTVISRYPSWAATHNPGHVNGLQLAHTPEGATWSDDARAHWDWLKTVRAEEPETASRQSYRAREKPRNKPSEENDDGCAVDPTWPLAAFVRGRHAVIVGGDQREKSRERLEACFGFASLEWSDTNAPRRIEALARRVEQRSVDLVIVLSRFISHSESECVLDAAKAADVPWLLAESYSITSIKSAMERFLTPAAAITRAR